MRKPNHWTVYLILAGLSDNILKPVLLGKGAPVPMLVIFLGVIGGIYILRIHRAFHRGDHHVNRV